MIGYSVWLAALAVGAHLVVRFTAPYADPVLLPVVTALNGLGLAMIYRIDLALGHEPLRQAADVDHARRRAVRRGAPRAPRPPTAAGVHLHARAWPRSCCCCCRWSRASASEINGARIWIGIGGFSFQPGEVAKLALVIAFAGYLVLHRDALALAGRRVAGIDLPRGRDLGPILGDVAGQPRHPGLPARPRLEPAVLRAVPGHALRRHRAARAGSSSAAALFAGRRRSLAYAFFSHVQTRVEGWLRPVRRHRRFGQIVEGLYGMAWGGLVGRGLGQGEPWRIPFAYSDFIVAAIGEELGLTGVIAVLLLFGLIVERAAAHRADLPRRLRQAHGHRASASSSRSRSSWSSAASPG